jgi:MFS family permease
MKEEAGSAPGAILAAAILASSMAFLDTSVVTLALPTILNDLGGSVAAGQWMVEAYLLFLTALLLIGGALGDRFGRKRVFACGIAFFAGASLACGLAATLPQLIVARALQGIGAAVMVPGSLAMISAGIAPARRGRALGLWSAATSVATALGPPPGAGRSRSAPGPSYSSSTFRWRLRRSSLCAGCRRAGPPMPGRWTGRVRRWPRSGSAPSPSACSRRAMASARARRWPWARERRFLSDS